MAAEFDREQLLAALDEIGLAAIAARTCLDIAVFGGSALMLASNFRYSTEDVDIAELGHAWPTWLSDVVTRIAARNSWTEHWLNDAVTFHLSATARPERDMVAFGTFPRAVEEVGLRVFVPTARYMLALKLKALRVADYQKGGKDLADVANILGVLQICEVEMAIDILGEYFPKTAADADKQRLC
jgi:hypothetical protein